MRGGRDAGEAAGKGSAAARAGSQVRNADRRCVGQSAPQRRSAPGFEAGEHHADVHGREAARLWPSQACRPAANRRYAQRCCHANFCSYRARHDRRHVSVHVAGAGRRERTGWAERRIPTGRGAIRNAHGSAGVPRQEPAQRGIGHSGKGASADQHGETDDAADARSCREEMSGENTR